MICMNKIKLQTEKWSIVILNNQYNDRVKKEGNVMQKIICITSFPSCWECVYIQYSDK